MRKIMLYIGLFFLFISCSRGVWVTQNVYRPRHPKFSILKNPFNPNPLINDMFMYASTRKFINYDGKRIYDFTGFYPDGRLIGCSFSGDELTFINNSNTWNTAFNIGYYTTEGDKIKLEYFVPEDGGQYVTKEGFIKKDTIILSETINLLLKKEVRSDTLIKCLYTFK